MLCLRRNCVFQYPKLFIVCYAHEESQALECLRTVLEEKSALLLSHYLPSLPGVYLKTHVHGSIWWWWGVGPCETADNWMDFLETLTSTVPPGDESRVLFMNHLTTPYTKVPALLRVIYFSSSREWTRSG